MQWNWALLRIKELIIKGNWAIKKSIGSISKKGFGWWLKMGIGGGTRNIFIKVITTKLVNRNKYFGTEG